MKRFSILIPASFFVLTLTVLIAWILLSGGENSRLVIILAASAIILLLVASILFYFKIFVPLSLLSGKLSNLDKGEIPEINYKKQNNELGDLEESLKEHFEYLNKVIQFTTDISKGDINDSFIIRGGDDQIGKAMLQLKERLNTTKIEAEKRRAEDEQQNWAAQGLATIGELLRNTEDDISIMSNEFIRELVKYVDMEVGGFFIVNDDDDEDPELELTGSYAFDREKHLERRFKFGEGLVGRCAVERESIIITDLPNDYIRIRSGLGEDQPSTLVLVPVLLDEQVLGVIELASFNEVPEYKIKFVKSLSNSIAASVTKVKVNISTSKLLQQSRQQSEELSSREEEMRKGLEKLKSTQEKSAKREAQLMEEIVMLKKG